MARSGSPVYKYNNGFWAMPVNGSCQRWVPFMSGYGGIIVWTINEGLLPANATGGRAPNALTQALKHAFLDP